LSATFWAAARASVWLRLCGWVMLMSGILLSLLIQNQNKQPAMMPVGERKGQRLPRE
jgi:hypothetical protein